jgi:hypothetical protein
MPRIISFSATTAQFRARAKSVTRRVGWLKLHPGTLLLAVKQARGLKAGEKMDKLGLIIVEDARREPLNRMCTDLAYGWRECALEGFEGRAPADFVRWFCRSHNCQPDSIITRIEYSYVEGGNTA